MPIATIAARWRTRRRNFSITERWAADTVGKNVIEVEVQLGDDADILSTGLCRRNDCLDAELHRLPGPDDPGVDRADRLLAIAVGNRRGEPEFYQRGQPVDPFGQAKIVNVGTQIKIAVLHRESVI